MAPVEDGGGGTGMVAGAIALAEVTVQHTPSEPGIYHLYRGDELTYIGSV
jgi:hypothetical protein